MRGTRVGNEQRSQYVLLLLSKLPERLTLKEINDLMESITDQRLNRNSLRKTLEKLVGDNLVQSTRDEANNRGRGEYFIQTGVDLFRNVAVSLPKGNRALAKNVGAGFVSSSFEHILDLVKYECNFSNIEDIHTTMKFFYPFLKLYYDGSGSLKVLTKFEILEHSDEVIKLRIFPCLCNGQKKYSNACSMVAGALAKICDLVTGFSFDSSWIGDGVDEENGSYCKFKIYASNKESESHSTPDEVVERNHAIPGL